MTEPNPPTRTPAGRGLRRDARPHGPAVPGGRRGGDRGALFRPRGPLPITVAVILSFMLAPLVARFQRWHVPHVAAVLLAVLIAIGIVGGIAGVIGTQVAGIAADIPQYQATIKRKISSVQSMTTGRLRGLTQRLNSQMGKGPTQPDAEPAAPAAGTPKAQLVEVQPPPTSAMELARTVLEPVLSPLATLFIILIVTIFVLMQREDLRDRMIRLFGSNDLQRTTVALDDAGRRLGRYYLSQLAINVAFGAVATLGSTSSASRRRRCGASPRRSCASCPTSGR